MKLVLLSGGRNASNLKLHQIAVKMAKKSKNRNQPLTLTYIPSCHENHLHYFNRMRRRYQRLGIKKFNCLNVDQNPSKTEIEEALQSDLIYLAGGNTFYFLKHLRETGMLGKIKSYALNGGVLVGLSAGGLLMTPTVQLAADEGMGPDDAVPGLTQFKSMNLIPFEFSPHYINTPKDIRAHLLYSTKTKNPIYAVQDGGGIVVDDHIITFYGKYAQYHQGTRFIYR